MVGNLNYSQRNYGIVRLSIASKREVNVKFDFYGGGCEKLQVRLSFVYDCVNECKGKLFQSEGSVFAVVLKVQKR